MGKKRRLQDEYQFPGFRPMSKIQGIFGDPKARVLILRRIQKKRFADAAVQHIADTTTRKYNEQGICLAGMSAYIWMRKSGESSVRNVAR